MCSRACARIERRQAFCAVAASSCVKGEASKHVVHAKHVVDVQRCTAESTGWLDLVEFSRIWSNLVELNCGEWWVAGNETRAKRTEFARRPFGMPEPKIVSALQMALSRNEVFSARQDWSAGMRRFHEERHMGEGRSVTQVRGTYFNGERCQATLATAGEVCALIYMVRFLYAAIHFIKNGDSRWGPRGGATPPAYAKPLERTASVDYGGGSALEIRAPAQRPPYRFSGWRNPRPRWEFLRGLRGHNKSDFVWCQ
jgi:hypothetical protein